MLFFASSFMLSFAGQRLLLTIFPRLESMFQFRNWIFMTSAIFGVKTSTRFFRSCFYFISKFFQNVFDLSILFIEHRSFRCRINSEHTWREQIFFRALFNFNLNRCWLIADCALRNSPKMLCNSGLAYHCNSKNFAQKTTRWCRNKVMILKITNFYGKFLPISKTSCSNHLRNSLDLHLTLKLSKKFILHFVLHSFPMISVVKIFDLFFYQSQIIKNNHKNKLDSYVRKSREKIFHVLCLIN